MTIEMDFLRDQALQARNLEILVRNDGFKFTNSFFAYTSGKIGPYYVNSEAVMKDGRTYAEAIDSVSKYALRLMGDFIISGGETRDWIFSNPVAVKQGNAHVSLYKDGKMLGADVKERNVIHIADLNNEGSSPRDFWIPMIRKAGGVINDIVFYVDRMEEGAKVMKDLGLKSIAVVQLDEFAWEYLRRRDIINSETYANLIERMNNKEKWAEDMLISNIGIENLSRLFSGAKKSRERAFKILDTGYPTIKEEILDRLKSKGLKIKNESHL